jgi:hypothetical protein
MTPLVNRDPGDETHACECRFRGDGDSDVALLVQGIDPHCLTHGHLLEDRLLNRFEELAWEHATETGNCSLRPASNAYTRKR